MSDYLDANASFANNGTHRLGLYRRWGSSFGPAVTFVGLNPSTADADHDDPTIRRCVGFARAWGFACLHMANLHTQISTDPDELGACEHPERADHALRAAVADSALVVAAWGAHPAAEARASHVIQQGFLGRFAALKLTQSGAPGHPLYLAKTTRPFYVADRTPVVLPCDAAPGPPALDTLPLE